METNTRAMLVRGAEELGVKLGVPELEKFSTYLDLLQLWGRKMNLTSRLRSREVVAYHFLDSLSGYPLLKEAAAGRAVDVGSGAGFPALPLKICLPGLNVTMIESSRKKVAFCQEVARQLGLTGLAVLWGRGEEISTRPGHSGDYDWALSRAMAPAAKTARICLPFLRPGGRLLLFKGDLEEEELRLLDKEIRRYGADYTLQPVKVPYLEAARTLVVVRTCST